MMLKLEMLKHDIDSALYEKLFNFFLAEDFTVIKCKEYADKLTLQFSEKIAQKAVEICGEE